MTLLLISGDLRDWQNDLHWQLKRLNDLEPPAHQLMMAVLDGHESHATFDLHRADCRQRTLHTTQGDCVRYPYRYVGLHWRGVTPIGWRTLIHLNPIKPGHADHVPNPEPRAKLNFWPLTLACLNVFPAFRRRNLKPALRRMANLLDVARRIASGCTSASRVISSARRGERRLRSGRRGFPPTVSNDEHRQPGPPAHTQPPPFSEALCRHAESLTVGARP